VGMGSFDGNWKTWDIVEKSSVSLAFWVVMRLEPSILALGTLLMLCKDLGNCSL
jgi:hypothetical protein